MNKNDMLIEYCQMSKERDAARRDAERYKAAGITVGGAPTSVRSSTW